MESADAGIPRSLEGLTLEWMTSAIDWQARFGADPPIGLEVTNIGEGISASGLVGRLDLAYPPEIVGAPSSMIAKLPAPPTEQRGRQARQVGSYPHEITFYLELSGHCLASTPEMYLGGVDLTTGDAVILLQDLAPARPGDIAEGCTDDEALQLVSELARFHAGFWGRTDLHGRAYRENSYLNQLAGRFQEGWEDARDWMVDDELPEVALLGDAAAAGRDFVKFLHQPPLTIAHGDLRLDNIFFRDWENPTGIVLADFQQVFPVRGVLDLALFLIAGLTTEQRRRGEAELLRRYIGQLRELGVSDYPLSDLMLDYARSAVLICLRTLVANMAFPEQAHRRRPALERSVTAIRDLGAMEATEV